MRYRVQPQRLWETVTAMGRIGALDHGGCCRLALSPLDGEGRDLFVKWCKEAGCAVTIDDVGNIYARRTGRDVEASAVATGSHLDTQPHGGKFDGIYGVLAGLEVVRTLNDHDVATARPIEVIVWTNEEAARFGPPMSGSSVFAGKLPAATLHATRTADGTTVHEDLLGIGYIGAEKAGAHPLHAFVEAHIEQGPILEQSGSTIGVVTHVQGGTLYRVTVTGEDGHAGTVPMSRRRDACLAAALMIARLHALARETDEAVRMTIGTFRLEPNSMSTIPGKASFSIDCRHPSKKVLAHLREMIGRELREIASPHGLDVQIEIMMDNAPVEFDSHIVGLVEHSAAALGFSHQRIVSGAGHDAMNVARVAPTGMIFVPCRGGVSHNEAEYASPEHLAAGADVLLHALLELAADTER